LSIPYTIEHLIGEQRKVTSVHHTDRTKVALDLMIEHDFSQLPVLDETGRILGMVTRESILRAEHRSSDQGSRTFTN
jgi:CBS domain-containing protein